MFLSMSLLTECHRWSRRATSALERVEDNELDEMHLLSALGVSLMFTSGGQRAARDALARSLRLAEARGGVLDQIHILAPLQMFHLRTGEFGTALDHAKQCAKLAERLDDPVSMALAHSLVGISLHLNGDLTRARTALEAALRHGSRCASATTNYLGFDGGLLAGAILARTLCGQGYPEQAVERALLTIEDAEALNHPLTLAIVLVWAVSVYLYVGDLDSAEVYNRRLFACAEPHSLGPYLLVGRGFQGELAIRRGDVDAGVGMLQHSLAGLHAAPYELLSTPLSLALVQGLAATHRHPEALSLLDETIQSVETHGDFCYMPELLRVRAALMLAAPRPCVVQAHAHLAASLEWSRRQGARAWELRAAFDFARLLAAQGERERARNCLRPVFETFTDGADAPDVRAAADLLASLR
jgi:tetratricopeptide (TPR) repeat protein